MAEYPGECHCFFALALAHAAHVFLAVYTSKDPHFLHADSLWYVFIPLDMASSLDRVSVFNDTHSAKVVAMGMLGSQ